MLIDANRQRQLVRTGFDPGMVSFTNSCKPQPMYLRTNLDPCPVARILALPAAAPHPIPSASVELELLFGISCTASTFKLRKLLRRIEEVQAPCQTCTCRSLFCNRD